ncbi:MAG: hypothetical protein GY859_13365 [Desulfobacterales bacterium]|nr:hypothetical protein [Desulfobacterales bacterium]
MRIRWSARYGLTPATIQKVIAVCLLLIPAILLVAPGAWAEPHYGGKLRLAVEGKVYGFDAVKGGAFTQSTQTVANLVMEPLFDLGENGEILPLLGLSMDSSADGKTWTISLRQGVTFHDGAPFNADAVVGNWRRLLDPKSGFRGRVAVDMIESVEKADEYTVRYQLSHPWKPFPILMTLRKSKALLVPSPKAVADDVHNRAPVGTGPYVFKSWKSGDHILLTKNKNYWNPGKPYLDEVVVRMIPDPDTRYAALASGQVDVIATDRPTHIKKLKADPRFSAAVGEGAGVVSLILNTRVPPLDDDRVRRALAHAWDQEKIINMVFKDIVPFVTHWYGETMTCGDVGYRRPDLEKARALIKEYGKPVELEYIHSATARGAECGAVIQQLFKRIGVKVKTTPLDWGAIYKRFYSGKFNLASWAIGGADQMSVVTRLTFQTKGVFNRSGYSNETVDRLLMEQKMSMDPEVRQKALCEVVRHVNNDAPMLFLSGNRHYLFSSVKVKGLPLPRHGNVLAANVWMDLP